MVRQFQPAGARPHSSVPKKDPLPAARAPEDFSIACTREKTGLRFLRSPQQSVRQLFATAAKSLARIRFLQLRSAWAVRPRAIGAPQKQNQTENKRRFPPQNETLPASDRCRWLSRSQPCIRGTRRASRAQVRSPPAPLRLKQRAPKSTPAPNPAVVPAHAPAALAIPCDISHAAALRKSNKDCTATTQAPAAYCRLGTFRKGHSKREAVVPCCSPRAPKKASSCIL